MYNRSVIVRFLAPTGLVVLTAAIAVAAKPAAGSQSAADLTRRIDDAIDARLKAENVKPAAQADDAEFLRRVYLDLTGHIPPGPKAVAFLDDRSSDKRARLIDELLASPMFGRHMADVWEALMVAHNSDNRFLSFEPLRQWLENAFNKDTPWNTLVTDLLTVTGSPEENGAAVYFMANQPVDKVTDNASKLFLGVQLQCAQCHNHPFTKWKQTEYWGMAAFFLKVQAQVPRPVAVAKGMVAGVRELEVVRPGKRGLPDSAKIVPAKFLGGEEPKVGPREMLRPVFAKWLTSAENPYFSRAMVNRTWSLLFGRGFVNPVDDMHDANSPSHPELLADLAKQFAADGFDVKNLYRAICNTRAYQRTSKVSDSKSDAPPELFARMAIKVLTPEQMFDSLTLVLGNPDRQQQGRPNGKGGKGQFGGKGVFEAKGALNGKGGLGALPGNQNADKAKEADKAKDPEKAKELALIMATRQQELAPRNVFVTFFKSEDADVTEYQNGIPQALRLMNAPQLNAGIAYSPLLHTGKPAPQAVQDLYLHTLSRRPTPHELERSVAYVGRQRDARQGLSDVLWALLNSSEFSMNH
jgi:hypothetical protein